MTALTGGCDCGAIRYRMETRPLFVHCCHCRWCQRETGASFALNALIATCELDRRHGDGRWARTLKFHIGPPRLVFPPALA